MYFKTIKPLCLTAFSLSIFRAAAQAPLQQQAACSTGFEPCAPKGATSLNLPPLGPGLGTLFTDLMDAVTINNGRVRVRTDNSAIYNCDPNNAGCALGWIRDNTELDTGLRQVDKRPCARETIVGIAGSIKTLSDKDLVAKRDDRPSICCADATQCLLLRGFDVPFCWDRFTTNFFLPARSYGNLANATLINVSGVTLNLLNGTYFRPVTSIISFAGQPERTSTFHVSGNIYTADPANRPNTATVTLPTPWTSSGVGSAIPPTGLGGMPGSQSSSNDATVTTTGATMTTSKQSATFTASAKSATASSCGRSVRPISQTISAGGLITGGAMWLIGLLGFGR